MNSFIDICLCKQRAMPLGLSLLRKISLTYWNRTIVNNRYKTISNCNWSSSHVYRLKSIDQISYFYLLFYSTNNSHQNFKNPQYVWFWGNEKSNYHPYQLNSSICICTIDNYIVYVIFIVIGRFLVGRLCGFLNLDLDLNCLLFLFVPGASVSESEPQLYGQMRFRTYCYELPFLTVLSWNKSFQLFHRNNIQTTDLYKLFPLFTI